MGRFSSTEQSEPCPRFHSPTGGELVDSTCRPTTSNETEVPPKHSRQPFLQILIRATYEPFGQQG